MRNLLFAFLMFSAQSAAAQARAPDTVSLQAHPLTSTLPAVLDGAEGGNSGEINEYYQLLPMVEENVLLPLNEQSGGQKDATKPATPNDETRSQLKGYILNRQLVEQTARNYPDSGLQIGQGWNSFLNRTSANVCIEGTVAPMKGTQINASMKSVENTASYLKAISGSAGGSYGAFSGSGSYSKQHSFSQYDVNVVMSAVVDTGGEFVSPGPEKNIRLSDRALELLRVKNGQDRFLQACGDSYVTAYRVGGRMDALLTISNQTVEDKETIEAQAKGGFGSFSANASFRQSVVAASDAKNLEVSYEQVGGIISGIPATLDEMLTKFTQYKVDKNFNPKPYVFYTLNYRSLPNWPAGLENRVSPVDQEYFVLSYQNFSDFAVDYDRAIQAPDKYVNFLAGGAEEIKKLRDIALLHARNLDSIIWQCVEKFTCSVAALDSFDKSYQGRVLAKFSGRTEEDDIPSRFEMGLVGGTVELVAVPIDTPDDVTIPLTRAPGTPRPPVVPRDRVVIRGETPAAAKTNNPELSALVVSHYRLLAGLPLFKNEKSHLTGFTARPDVNGTPPTDVQVISAFKEWLISNRLRPAAQSYCRESANHPLCLTDRELNYVLGLLDIAAGPLRSIPPVVVPPIPLPIRTHEEPREREGLHGPCIGPSSFTGCI